MLALLLTSILCMPQGLTEADFRKVHDDLKPPIAEPWREIPWQVSLVEAQNLAAKAKQPLFLWSMDGHPLGSG